MTEFEKKIGYSFKDPSLLERALTHSSFANENGHRRDNERLEFLGDSVLGMVSAEYLYKSFDYPEGQLTKIRAGAVCEKSLAEFASRIDLGSCLRLGKGEENTGGRDRASILSDAFEAVIAAIYLDGGFEPAKKFILRFIKDAKTDVDEVTDYKTILQEVIQKNPGEQLTYAEVAESGPAHMRTFTVEVHLNSNCIGTGEGHSKKKAEQEAAKEALRLMGIVK